MKRTRTLENNEISIYKQASGSVYGILDHDKHESNSLPVNPNFLLFKDKTLNSKFTESLFKDFSRVGPSAEFRHNMKNFYIFHLAFLILSVVITSLQYTYGNQSYSHMILRNTLLCFIFCLSLLTGFLILKVPGLLLKSQRVFLSLSILIIFYLIICDERVLSGISGTSYKAEFSGTILIVGFYITMFKYLFFSSFYHLAIITFSSLVVSLVFLMVFSTVSVLNSLADFFVLLLFLAIELMETHQNDFRTKQLFYRKQMEEENLDNYEMEFNNGRSTAASICTEIELIIENCDKIKQNLKSVTAVIMYKDVKRKLKSAQSDLERVKKHLAQGTLTNISKIDNYLNITDDDKKFIVQNFTNVNNFTSKKVKLISAKPSSAQVWLDCSVEIEHLMSSVGHFWNLDMWFIYNSTGQSISLIGKYLLDKWQLNSILHVSNFVIESFMGSLESAYLNNPYHNSCHASDVIHNVLYFFTNSFIISSLSPLELLSAIIAGLGHDVAHPALNNKYLIATRSEIALIYNDKSVLENMHISKIYSILSKDDCNLLVNLNDVDWHVCRKIIIEMILETDMSKHFESLGKFRTRCSSIGDIDLDSSEDKLFVMCMAIKCADIGHSAKILELHEKWTYLVCDEFFRQGDMEKERKLPVSIYCDRETTDLAKSQAGFIKNICMPLYEAWGNYLKCETIYKNCCEQLKSNLKNWECKIKNKES